MAMFGRQAHQLLAEVRNVPAESLPPFNVRREPLDGASCLL